MHPHRRVVRRAPLLLEDATYREHREAIHYIFAQTATGGDLRPHLSRDIDIGYAPRTPGKHRRDLDLLLNDWGVHHLHLSRHLDVDGYVTRGDPVLCAIFREEEAYFLGLIRHGEWAEKQLVETAVKTWPKENYFLGSGLLPGQDLTASERVSARRNHVTTAVNVDGRVYLPAGGGITRIGLPTKVTLLASQFQRRLHAYEDNPELLAKAFQQAIGYSKSQWPRRPRYNLPHVSAPTRYCFAIQEQKTGLWVGI